MKKGIQIGLTLLLLIPMLIVPEEVQAKTVGDLRAKLNELQAEYEKQVADEKNTKDKVSQNKNTIAGMQAIIQSLEKEVAQISSEIVSFQSEIEKKQVEIKNVINFMQISSGENAYLEYAIGAQDFTDFIYRMSVSEQLADYNKALTKEYETMINDNKKKTEELEIKQQQLVEEKAKLLEENKKMSEHLDEVATIKIDVEEEIEMQRNALKVLEKLGCKDYEDVNTCGRVIIPPSSGGSSGESSGGGNAGSGPDNSTTDTTFLRPIIDGYVTSEYGWRTNPISGVNELHEAIDMSKKGYVPIYAAAPGIVINARVKSSCGGNMIFIVHTINGQKYTTEYAHLRSINVSVGQQVTANTQIGVMGGDKNIETWDKCSTVQHLHFGIATGHYFLDYSRWNDFLKRTYDPRKTINFPWSGGATDYFKDRTTIY